MITEEVRKGRLRFGGLVRERRLAKGFTQVALGKLIGLCHTNIVAIEKGRRAVGNQLAQKLLDVFALGCREREPFLMLAAATRINARLLEFAKNVHPELIHYAVS